MKLKIALFLSLLILICVNCRKSHDSTVDYANYVVGTYKGLFSPGQLNGSVVLNKQSNSRVIIDLRIAGGDTLHYTNATVSDDGSGKLIISLMTDGTTINGSVNVTTLDCYFNQLHFIGTMQ